MTHPGIHDSLPSFLPSSSLNKDVLFKIKRGELKGGRKRKKVFSLLFEKVAGVVSKREGGKILNAE